MEAPNRGKRSLGLGLNNPEARPVLEKLIAESDVSLTNYLPGVRRKLRIDVDDVRAINPDIIYVVGSGYGMDGPDSDTGEPSVVDVSLLSVGAWATQFSVNLALLTGGPLLKTDAKTQAPGNP